MRLALLIPWVLIGHVLSGQFTSLLGQGVAALIHDVSDMADGSITQARLEAQRQAAGAGPAYRSSHAGEYMSFSGKYSPPELPEDRKGRFVYGLAVFSDDGCNVTIKGNLIHQRAGQGQHLPSLGDSFHLLPVVLTPGEPVDITVDYSNTIYDDDPESSGYPDIDGCTLFLYLIPAGIAVDANRDGAIAFSGEARDVTSQDAPFRFWCNDDDDSAEEDNPESHDKDAIKDNHIQSLRDLEDFARLHITIGGLQEAIAKGIVQVGLEWQDVQSSSSPAIKVYQAAEPDGGDRYLKPDNNEYYASLQQGRPFKTALGIIDGSNGFKFPHDFWKPTPSGITTFDAEHPNRYIIFEGVTEGKGKLVITFWNGTTKLGQDGGSWLEIKNIKKMYQRWDSASANPWTPDQFIAPLNETKRDAIIFVHGWKMSPAGAENFAETMFKRLWHRGFRGRFIAYHWDTYWFNSWKWVNDLAGVDVGAALAHYNDSEYIAWQDAATALKNHVNHLDFTNKNIVAHSMGNIVVGQALNEEMAVNNYALLNAAVPAACYDEDEGRIKQTTRNDRTVKLLGAMVTFTMWDYPSPDGDIDPRTRALAYRGTLKRVGQNATLINFFLPDDFATSVAWEINNDITKPPSVGAPLNAGFEYEPSLSSGHKLYKYNILTGSTEYYITHKPEAMAYACRTWGKVVGTFEPTRGAVNGGSVDMSNPAIVGAGSAGFGTEHSAAFNGRIQQTTRFYNLLLDELEIERNSP